jgi:hypothetical protein
MQQQDSSDGKDGGAINNGESAGNEKNRPPAAPADAKTNHGQLREQTLSLVLSTDLTYRDSDEDIRTEKVLRYRVEASKRGESPIYRYG